MQKWRILLKDADKGCFDETQNKMASWVEEFMKQARTTEQLENFLLFLFLVAVRSCPSL